MLYIETCSFNLACIPCPEHQHGSYNPGHDSDSMPTRDITPALSKCSMSIQELDKDNCTPVPNTPGLTWCGAYYGQCHLCKEHECSFPGAHEDTVVHIDGLIYRVTEAVKVGPASTVPTTDSCAPPSSRLESADKPATNGEPFTTQANRHTYKDIHAPDAKFAAQADTHIHTHACCCTSRRIQIPAHLAMG